MSLPRTIAFALTLAGCGGGGTASEEDATRSATAESGSADASDSGEDTGGATSGTDSEGSGDETDDLPPPVGSVITTIIVEGGQAPDVDVPVTFGQAFVIGDVPAPLVLAARFSDEPDSALPLQTDTKATHSDGSMRHALLTLVVPELEAGQSREVELVSAEAWEADPITLDALLATDVAAEVELVLGSSTYRASVREVLVDAERTWIEGNLATEWNVAAPLTAENGSDHPHLTARFDLRAHRGLDRVRVDVVVENNWAYEPGPANVTYDASIRVGGEVVAQYDSLTHFHHARWRHTAWSGAAPDVHLRHDAAYLVQAGAIPSYDLTLEVPEQALAGMADDWATEPTGPMELGLTSPGMPAPGARPDIGPLPRWAARYLLSMDPRAKTAVLGTGSLAGSWSIHYRDRATDQPVSLYDHPNMSLLAEDGAGDDAFPSCLDCDSPYNPDSAHQPSLAYVPYLLTGDRYHLEELLFWANWNIIRGNPGSRDQEKGLVQWEQVRGQAWSLRTLAHAAFITPDDDPMREYFEEKVAHNLTWYGDNYLDNPGAPNLGFLEARTYGGLGIVPWMDDFFTHTLTWMVAMGFDDATPILEYKARFPVGRMIDPGFCWVWASLSAMFVRDSETSPYYPSFGEVYAASVEPNILGLECGSAEMAAAGGLPEGAMDGYPFSPTGYPSCLQPALAAAVDAGVDGAVEAWDLFMSREVLPEYADYPNYAIVPLAP